MVDEPSSEDPAPEALGWSRLDGGLASSFAQFAGDFTQSSYLGLGAHGHRVLTRIPKFEMQVPPD